MWCQKSHECLCVLQCSSEALLPIRWHEWVSWQIPSCSACTEASLTWMSLNFSLVPCLQHHVLHQKWKKVLLLLDFLATETWFTSKDKKVVDRLRSHDKAAGIILALSGTWTKTLIILMAPAHWSAVYELLENICGFLIHFLHEAFHKDGGVSLLKWKEFFCHY